MTRFEDMAEALKALGFESVEETAVGAQFVSREYERIIKSTENLNGRVMISSLLSRDQFADRKVLSRLA